MDNLSAFQFLPYHVVNMIVDHVVGSSRLRFDDVSPRSDEYISLQIPLLWVCRNLRVFMLLRFGRVYNFNFNDLATSRVSTHTWPACLERCDYPTHLWAKELWFAFDIESVYFGEVLEQMASVPCSFPLVRKLVFDISIDWTYSANDSDSDYTNKHDVMDGISNINDLNEHSGQKSKSRDFYPSHTPANIAEFARLIKQMAPAISEIDVEHAGEISVISELLRNGKGYVLHLARELFGIIEKHTVITPGSGLLSSYLDLEPIRDLVRIDYVMNPPFHVLAPVIRRSSRTLKILKIRAIDLDLTDLVKDLDGGGYLEYPRLHILSLHTTIERGRPQTTVFKDIVPFPGLSCLTMLLPYPFDDDVLFRGNDGVLEYLDIKLFPETVLILKEYRVFTPTSHPNLKNVTTCMTVAGMPNPFSTVTDYMQFALSIAPGAPVRTIYDLTRYRGNSTPELLLLKDHGCIQILSLPDTCVSFWEAILLVILLPLLSDLHAIPLTIGNLPQGVSMAMFPYYVRMIFTPMGVRFRCWHIITDWSEWEDCVEVATCVLSLALVCPNFDYAAVERQYRERFMKVMQDKIDEPGFSRDAPRLKRLLFNGWNDC